MKAGFDMTAYARELQEAKNNPRYREHVERETAKTPERLTKIILDMTAGRSAAEIAARHGGTP